MKKASILFAVTLMAASVSAQTGAVSMKTAADSVNYAYGISIANQFKKMMDKDANVALFVAGFNAAISGTDERYQNFSAIGFYHQSILSWKLQNIYNHSPLFAVFINDFAINNL